MIQPKVIITISRTANGQSDYLQVTTPDGMALNFVVVAGEIVVEDSRPKPKRKAKQ